MKYSEELAKRKKLYNQVQESKGNIRVFCRCRSLSKEEIASGYMTVVDFEVAKDGDIGITSSGSTKKSFKFDRVFTPKNNQEQAWWKSEAPLNIDALYVLRMELDIQKFMWSTDQFQFEFQHFPTSYLRCAAHRVAQHYGLQTVALDYTTDGLGSRIVARKTPESKFPAICLSDIHTKQQPENYKTEKVKIAIRPRQNNLSMVDSGQLGNKRNSVRTVEEREEDYDQARARIFSGSPKPVVNLSSTSVVDEKSSVSSSTCLQESYRTLEDNTEKINLKDGASRVAIFRDREKDMTDPDYDRSYNRYVKGIAPSHSYNLAPCNVLQPSPLQFQEGISHLGQLSGAQPLVSYRLSDPAMSTFCAVGCSQFPLDAVYMQWPNPAVLYAQTYEPFRRTCFQAPVYQKPLSFERWQSY